MLGGITERSRRPRPTSSDNVANKRSGCTILAVSMSKGKFRLNRKFRHDRAGIAIPFLTGGKELHGTEELDDVWIDVFPVPCCHLRLHGSSAHDYCHEDEYSERLARLDSNRQPLPDAQYRREARLVVHPGSDPAGQHRDFYHRLDGHR